MSEHWNEGMETISRAELENLQGERLQQQVAYVYENSRFWRERYDSAGVHPRDIRSLADLYKLPVTSKDDLRAQRHKTKDLFSDTLCVPRDQLVKVNHSTGTSGTPNIYGLNQFDWDNASDAFARSLYRVGLRLGDSTNNWLESAMTWHGYFMSAHGARRIGAIVYGCEPDNRSIAQTTLEMLADADLNCIFIYHPELEVSYLRSKQLTPKDVHPHLRFIYSSALTTDTRRKVLEEAWGVPYFNLGGGGDQYLSMAECVHSKPYLHALEDRFIIEVLNPETLEPVQPGEVGELVITNLWAQATPYIRYRLEDMVVSEDAPCACGSVHKRLKFFGRMAWSVDVQGRRVFSDEVENVLWRYPETEFSQYQIVRYETQPQSKLVVRCTHQDYVDSTDELRDRLIHALQADLQVPCDVEFVTHGEIGIGTVKFERVLRRTGND